MLKINRVHHIAIICTDYERSKHFYTVILGFKPVREVFRAERNSYKLDLEVAGQYQIELFSFLDPPVRPSRPEAAGLRHLAFEVDSVEAAAVHLQQYSIKTEPIRVDETTGKRFTFFTDPDGLPLEFYQR
jgi:glyoxylase I family protein